ncbi:aminotransferase class V-fold PLP-dependent enzyme [Sedimentitalea sp. JM2-8]|uniref:Aminotransferase class V-fold PLP-dependent enzyme n=1 Tax=Sedimentitalea xiamensis TaxID=3050037 RepID=A0ABT7FF28_9RHOB|nr:aminotransferase class V-fold PLP-dependent enzyme [Sedimentitalea xiamensis]MDK3073736.1 aminotransferase class V-fold PLP-dependent enzyme [Sedimentitalea xiamensis]
MTLPAFRDTILAATDAGTLRDGLIGENILIPGLNGDVPLVYADYVASGRALRQVEDFIATHVLPFYANSHTEASFCGAHMTRLRRAARAEISRIVGAGENDKVIFAGSGATAGLNRLVSLFGVNEARSPAVFIGPYEHHSNILPWRESKAKVVEIPEARHGGVDIAALAEALAEHAESDLKIGSFSAASNVTGVITDTGPVTRLLKAHGALSVWDYAGAGPYLPIDMADGAQARKDAVVVSPHKFPGGPGASGVLVVNQSALRRTTPSWPGGGTVSFVSPWRHDYSADLASREEAGTPNVIGDIRAALAFIVKDAVGTDAIAASEARFNRMALEGWRGNPHLELLGADHPHRLPIFSFRVRDAKGAPVHQQLFTRMLSDVYGIQARGGCACAGPYAHRLLQIGEAESTALHRELAEGRELRKPGWVRLNFSYMMDDRTARFIIDSVNALSRTTEDYAPRYAVDSATARFKPMSRVA